MPGRNELSSLASEINRMLQSLEQSQIEQKKAEDLIRKQNERLKELDRMKSEFLATAAHELRTPLNSIVCFSKVLLERRKQLEEKKKIQFLQIINEQSLDLAASLAIFLVSPA